VADGIERVLDPPRPNSGDESNAARLARRLDGPLEEAAVHVAGDQR